MEVLLGFYLLLALVACYLLFDKDLVAPATLFTTGLFLCSLGALYGKSIWGGSLSAKTVGIIMLSVLTFIVCAWVSRSWVRYSVREQSQPRWRQGSLNLETLVGANWVFLVLILLVQIITLVWTAKEISVAYPASTIFGSIGKYDYAAKFSTTGVEEFPFLLRQLRGVCGVSAGLLCCLTAAALTKKAWRLLWLLVPNLMLAIAISLETGGRTTAVSYFVFIFISYLVMRRMAVGNRAIISPRILLAVLLSAGFVISVFQSSLVLLGRQSKTDFWHYIAIYIGAQIPNLDTFLSTFQGPISTFWGQMTFYTSYRWIGNRLGIAEFNYQLELPFMTGNGVGMGNVYTALYAFLYDFGVYGVVLLVAVMAFVAQFLYEKLYVKRSVFSFLVLLILYCGCGNSIFFSFFSNKFYEDFLTLYLINKTLYIVMIVAVYMMSLGWFRGSREKSVSESQNADQGPRVAKL